MLSLEDLRELTGVWALKIRAVEDGVLPKLSGLELQFEPKDVVSLCLATMAGEYGMEEANNVIDEFHLEELSFNKKPVK